MSPWERGKGPDLTEKSVSSWRARHKAIIQGAAPPGRFPGGRLASSWLDSSSRSELRCRVRRHSFVRTSPRRQKKGPRCGCRGPHQDPGARRGGARTPRPRRERARCPALTTESRYRPCSLSAWWSRSLWNLSICLRFTSQRWSFRSRHGASTEPPPAPSARLTPRKFRRLPVYKLTFWRHPRLVTAVMRAREGAGPSLGGTRRSSASGGSEKCGKSCADLHSPLPRSIRESTRRR